MKVAFIPVGDGEIELLQPKEPDSSLYKFLIKKGQGIHHISLSTRDIKSTIDEMKKKKVKFAEKTPKIGSHGVKIIFTDPKTTGGLTIEICEER